MTVGMCPPGIVYVAYDADRRPLYVGQTKNFKARMAQHRRKSPWWSEWAWLDVMHCDAARAVEHELIYGLLPIYNVTPIENTRRGWVTRKRRESAVGS